MRWLHTWCSILVLCACALFAATIAAPSGGSAQGSGGFAARFDGRLVVAAGGSFYTLGPGGSKARLLLKSDPSKAYLDSPTWSSDGKRLLFERSDSNGATIEIGNAKARGVVQVETSPPTGAHDAGPSWLADGRIAFVRNDPTGSCILVASVPLGESSTFLCRPHELPASAGLLAAPRWSSNGTVAFLQDRGVKEHGFTTSDQLTVLDDAGSHAVSSTVVQSFDWSPDGKRLVFVNPAKTISVVSADGTGERVLVRGTAPTWSPNGKWIAYRCYGAASAVCAIRPDGKGARTLGAAPATIDSLSWQPSRTKLACTGRKCAW